MGLSLAERTRLSQHGKPEFESPLREVFTFNAPYPSNRIISMEGTYGKPKKEKNICMCINKK